MKPGSIFRSGTLMALALIALLLRPVAVNAQLRGVYYHGWNMGSECITFLDDHHFTFRAAGCIQASEGYGTYKQMSNFLILSFEPRRQPNRPPDAWSAEGLGVSTNDSVHLELQLTDTNKEGIVGTSIGLIRENPGTISDIEGHATLLLPRTGKRIMLELNNMGERYFIPLIADQDYRILVTVNDLYDISDWAGEVLRYEISYNAKDYIILRSLQPAARPEVFYHYNDLQPR